MEVRKQNRVPHDLIEYRIGSVVSAQPCVETSICALGLAVSILPVSITKTRCVGSFNRGLPAVLDAVVVLMCKLFVVIYYQCSFLHGCLYCVTLIIHERPPKPLETNGV